jgi:hypothetical protein
MYEFEFEIFKYSYNLYLSNVSVGLNSVDTIDPSLVSVGLSYQTPKIAYLTLCTGSLLLVVL